MFLQILGSLLVLLVIHRLSKLWRSPGIGALDTHFCFFQPATLPAVFSPTSWNSFGLAWTWKYRLTSFGRLEETFQSIPLLSGKTTVWTTDPHIIKQVLNIKSTFHKDPQSVAAIKVWGDNVVTSNWETWKRQRRLITPVFSSSTYTTVWKETRRLYYEMVAEERWGRSPTLIKNINQYTSKLALLVISKCGFGLDNPWKQTPSPDIQNMSFGQALAKFSDTVAIRFIIPRWAYNLPIQFLRDVDAVHGRLDSLMRSYIESKKNEGRVSSDDNGPKDLLTVLVGAEDAEGLTPEEVMANVFVFMFGGHETTARTLAACLALLAVYPEEQDLAHKQIKAVLANDREPTVDDISTLTHITACFYEAARLFPSIIFFARDCQADEVLTHRDGSSFVLPANTRVYVDNVRIQYNPRLYPKPYEFKPSRWYGTQDQDHTFFGYGARSCPGRKFALTEGVCFLTLFLRDWVVEPDLKDGETPAEWRERVMNAECLGLGFGVDVLPLKVRKRG